MPGHEPHLHMDDRVGERPAALEPVAQPGGRAAEHVVEVLRVLPRDQVPAGRGPHQPQPDRPAADRATSCRSTLPRPPGAARRMASYASRGVVRSHSGEDLRYPQFQWLVPRHGGQGGQQQDRAQVGVRPSGMPRGNDCREDGLADATAGSSLHGRPDRHGAGDEMLERKVLEIGAAVDVSRLRGRDLQKARQRSTLADGERVLIHGASSLPEGRILENSTRWMPLQEVADQRDDLLVGVFQHIVPGVGQSCELRPWEATSRTGRGNRG